MFAHGRRVWKIGSLRKDPDPVGRSEGRKQDCKAHETELQTYQRRKDESIYPCCAAYSTIERAVVDALLFQVEKRMAEKACCFF